MWCKCNDLLKMGLNAAQIARSTGLDVKTVRKYLGMTLEEFKSSNSYKRMYVRMLDSYEGTILAWLKECPYLSTSQIRDRLAEYCSEAPKVSERTMYNFVSYVRAKHSLQKPSARQRIYRKVEETPYGKYAQADFGEGWMEREGGGRIKDYFFVMVLCRSRDKFVFHSLMPFTSELAVYAHELAFEHFGGKPEAIIYDQDTVLIRSENLGDYILTDTFGAFVSREGFRPVFCRKGDPESKGKVENVVKYVKGNFLRGRKFVSEDQLNEECQAWLERTGNGLPHGNTGLVPAEELKKEREYLTSYHGVPSRPGCSMRECTVRKDNTVQYKSNLYSLHPGTYRGQGTRVWADERDGRLDLYDGETGKKVASHPLANGRHGYVIDQEHRRQPRSFSSTLEHEVMEYCNGDPLVWQWLEGMHKDRERYYKQGLNVLWRGMRSYSPELLHEVFEICVDSGMHNANDFLKLCKRREAICMHTSAALQAEGSLPPAAGEVPDKTDISQYEGLFA